ncbi:jg5507 [Pararge aegeria aegeria]|uniref:Jg5507 protein n=1 Tax=Pararge aegeria aegeria TaxID=348720 RepID=A0A8S4SLM1_9NEOP|nr:jg5507 [Pararge aegeria aegeria]
MRRGNDSLEKNIVTGNTEGKRPRGRSTTRWADQLNKIKFGPLLSNCQNGLQQKPMETVYQREVEISPGPQSSVMKERTERERAFVPRVFDY